MLQEAVHAAGSSALAALRYLTAADLVSAGILRPRADAESEAPRSGMYSRVHLLRLEQSGLFPKRFYPTVGRAAWLESEVVAWLKSRVAQRDVSPSRPMPQTRPRKVRGRAGRCAAAV